MRFTPRPILLRGLTAAVTMAAAALPAAASPVTVVATHPVEMSLNAPTTPATHRVWREMIAAARQHVEVCAFYISNREGSRLEPVLGELIAAAARGVEVRVLADRGFYDTYPASLDRLAEAPGIEVRLLDYRALMGGPQHSKYFLVDGREAYVGSANFDWRALEHIHEVGLRVQLPGFVHDLGEVFAEDWRRAGVLGQPEGFTRWRYRGWDGPLHRRHHRQRADEYTWNDALGDTARLGSAFSPRDDLPLADTWDLPRLLALLDGAENTVNLTALSYNPHSRDGSYWPGLENALRRAAVRGVHVRVLLSDWNKRKPAIDFLKSLQHVPGIEVRLVTVPPAAEGFIPFARVIHAKYLTVDGRAAWVGTSNLEKSYFFQSRNVGLVAHSRELARTLEADFLAYWNCDHAYPVDPAVDYEPPRVGP